jgi:hypothetical protein
MPAAPPMRAPRSEHEPHRARRLAESFGSDPDRYDRARPGTQNPWSTGSSRPAPAPDALDVGRGIGIVARQFQAAGATVLGVDVDARMAGLPRRHGIEVEVAALEAWDPAGRAFDAVVPGRPGTGSTRSRARQRWAAASSRRPSCTSCWRAAGPRSTRSGGQLHDAVHRGRGHGGANRRPTRSPAFRPFRSASPTVSPTRVLATADRRRRLRRRSPSPDAAHRRLR